MRSDLVAQEGGCTSFRSLPSPAICHQLLRSSDLQSNTKEFQSLKKLSTVEWQQRKLMPTRSSCHREPTHNIRQSARQHATFVRERPCYITKSQDTQTLWKESRSSKGLRITYFQSHSMFLAFCQGDSHTAPSDLRHLQDEFDQPRVPWADSGKTANKPDKHHKRSNIQDPPTLKCPTHPTQAKRTDHGQQPHSLVAGLEAVMYHTWPVV